MTPKTDRVISARSRPLAALLAIVSWSGILLQGYLTMHTAIEGGKGITGGLVIYLGYFTILTNLLVCVALTASLWAPDSAWGKYFSRPEVMAWVATSIVFVGISYHVLLRHVFSPHGLHLMANDLLHYITPIGCLLYWWLAVPKSSLRWVQPFWWGLYPTLYLVYALIRGAIIQSYPYGFIDAGVLGYQRTFVNGIGLLVAFFALGLMFVALGRLQKKPPL
jgi:hypothetical protein